MLFLSRMLNEKVVLFKLARDSIVLAESPAVFLSVRYTLIFFSPLTLINFFHVCMCALSTGSDYHAPQPSASPRTWTYVCPYTQRGL